MGGGTLVLLRNSLHALGGAAIGALMLGGGMAYAAVSYLPHEVPTATNARKGTPFWTVAARAGLETRVLNVPVTFPVEEHDDLSMLSGLGVPDPPTSHRISRWS
jgi:hypothetical protein